MQRTTTLALSGLILFSGSAAAQPLIGAGTHLPIPAPNPGAPNSIARSVTLNSGGFIGSWAAPANSPWIGSFNAIGPVPGTTASAAGSTLYDFTTGTLPSSVLPIGTYFRFGDVDRGSNQTETFTLQAFDSTGIITSPWLDMPIGVTGTGIAATSMPSWNFDGSTGTYTFDGSSVVGNPNIAFYLTNNVALQGLEVQRSTTFSTFSLYAPVPSPGSAALLALGGLGVARRRRR